MTAVKNIHLIELTSSRRAEMARILPRLGRGVSVSTVAVVMGREMACRPTYREATSLLGQLQRSRRAPGVPGLTEAERFAVMRDARPDLYR
jgi:hypothetical protein